MGLLNTDYYNGLVNFALKIIYLKFKLGSLITCEISNKQETVPDNFKKLLDL